MDKPLKHSSVHPQAPPVSHLDQKITQIITSSVKGARRYRLPLIAATALLSAAFLAYGLFVWIHSAREEGLAQRLYQLVESPEAQEAEADSLLLELDHLVQDARGSDSERHILKSVSMYLSQKSFGKEPGSTFGPGSSVEGLTLETAPSERGPRDRSELLRRLEEWARLGQERFPKDKDMLAWSQNLLGRIKAEEEFNTRSQEKRSFAPLIPEAGPGSSPPGQASSSPEKKEDGAPPASGK